jgi:hypothetical protein
MNRYLRRLIARGIIPAGLGLRSDEGHPSGGGGSGDGTGAGDDEAANDQGANANGDNDQDGEGAPKGDDTDWKKASREWEKRAKANAKAAEELEKLKASQMSEQEKAVATAKAEGRAEAMKSAGVKLAAAELKSAAKDKGVNLADLISADLIKVESFVDEKGDVDSKAIEKAVAAFAKAAPAPTPGKSGAPIPGGSGGRSNTTPTLDSAVAARYGT